MNHTPLGIRRGFLRDGGGVSSRAEDGRRGSVYSSEWRVIVG